MSGTRAVPYIEYGGLATSPPPFTCSDVTLHGFFVRGDAMRLAALCDRVFTAPSGGRVSVRPVGSHVMLTFGTVDRVVPQRARFARMGSISERQVVVWVPVHAVERSGTAVLSETLGWFSPYVWVDNPLSLAGGREVYGYPKNWAWISVPGDDRAHLRATLDAFGGDYDSGERAARHRLVEITQTGTARRETIHDWWSGFEAVIDRLRPCLREGASVVPGSGRLAGALLDDLVARREFDQVMLRQFRSAPDGLHASQQQIVTVPIHVTHLRGGPLDGEFDLRLHHLDSHPLHDELGLSDQAVPFAFHVEMNFILHSGTVLWDAHARDASPPLGATFSARLEAGMLTATSRAIRMSMRLAELPLHVSRSLLATATRPLAPAHGAGGAAAAASERATEARTLRESAPAGAAGPHTAGVTTPRSSPQRRRRRGEAGATPHREKMTRRTSPRV